MGLTIFQPFISLLIPLHYPQKIYLEQLFESLPLNCPEVEFVIGINPNSKFSVIPFLKQWQLGAVWQIFEHDNILSVNAHFNFLQSKSRGVWLAPVDQDDRWQSGRWEFILTQLKNHQEYKHCMYASTPHICNEYLESMANFSSRFLIEPLLKTPLPFRWLRALAFNPVPGCCCIYSRSLLQVLGWPPAEPATPFYDHQLLLRTLLSPHCKLLELKGPSVDWRRHQGCVSGNRGFWYNIFVDRLNLIRALARMNFLC
jgi:hypothetical protein